MYLLRRSAVAAAAASAALILGAAAAPASAATGGADAVHRGSASCVNYSWGDGTATWTVYYHSTCDATAQFWVKTGATSVFETCITVKPDAKGSKVFYNKPLSFGYKKGSC
ncbi:hypothetical protein GCM10010269_17900 [Streptomyces humidus]|uniref:Uncharacterized protein n=1 Tax=Streptomyces humidus TaxID=52259 RepID=A0A918FTF3_9ACTN|nr:hypothetical protein [Streptomyces humidus]GGR79085.1 hypothetical protein GCM10010269_17900 [Streptomyces humidus]